MHRTVLSRVLGRRSDFSKTSLFFSIDKRKSEMMKIPKTTIIFAFDHRNRLNVHLKRIGASWWDK